MLNSIIGTDLSLSAFLICTAASLVLGIGLAFVSQFRARSTQSFAVTLAILPMVVQVVIMLVNAQASRWQAPSAWCVSAPHPVRPGRSACCFWVWPSALPPEWDT